MIYFMGMRNFAKKIREGFSKGDPSVKGMGIDHASIQRIYRLMKADSYEGSVAFYICEKLCEEVLGKTREGLTMMHNLKNTLPSTEEIISRFNYEKDKDVLFCALIGATIQSKDEVGKKCLDIICRLYQSA